MRIAAVQKTTLLDFPGKVACTVFLSGCNLRCPFCHNGGLVLPEQMETETVTPEALLAFLDRRKGILDGVCITGGEPTIQKDLPELLRSIRERGMLVKLDTNGSQPEVLKELMKQNLLDYVAMDIKNCPERYRETCGGIDLLSQVRDSAAALMEGNTEYEFRTTVSHPYHNAQSIAEITQWLQGAKRYFLQNFVDSGHLVGSGMTPMTEQEMKALLQAAQQYIPNTQIRGQ